MSLGSKLKDFFTTGGCVTQSKAVTLDTIQDALDLIKEIRPSLIHEGAPKVLTVVEQLVHWIDVVQKDMELIKADKLRTMLHDIAAIKIQLTNMVTDIDSIRKDQSKEVSSIDKDDYIEKIKDTVKKIKKLKEKKDDNK